jgi:hypothetical protein
MRFTPRQPIVPTRKEYDVVISQNFGRPIDGYRARTQPNGGSELHTVLVAEGLAGAGLHVAVIQPGAHTVRWGHVDYYSAQDVIDRGIWLISTDWLISQRFGNLPANVEFKRLAVEMHDLPDERVYQVTPAMAKVPGCKTIFHSNFNAELYNDFPGKVVIPAIIEDSLYELPALDRDSNRRDRVFVYGSAALKGLRETLELWGAMKRDKACEYMMRKAKLIVTSPGYDSPDFDSLRKVPGVEYQQQQTLGDMQKLLQRSDGIFMVNTLVETYGCIQTQCEVAGRYAWVFCPNGPGALKETLANPETVHTDINSFVRAVTAQKWPKPKPAKDVRASKVALQWLDALELKPKEMAA